MVSIMKMKACSVMTRMWNAVQPEAGDQLHRAHGIGAGVGERGIEGHQRDQDEDQLAGVHVAEQSQRQAERADTFLDDAQQHVRQRQQDLHRRGFGVERRGEDFLGEAADALVRDAEHLDQQEHRQREAERGVEVGGGHHAQVGVRRIVAGGDVAALPGPRQEVHRHHVHEVHQEHEAEDRDRQRRDQLAAAVEGFADEAVDHADHDLDDGLELAGHARGGLARCG